MTKVPERLISQLAHVELVNPDPERSAWFFHDVLGMEETTRENGFYFREPNGARVELNSGGYRNYEPDLQTVHWMPQLGSNDWYRTSVFPESMGECFPHGEADRERARQMVAAYND